MDRNSGLPIASLLLQQMLRGLCSDGSPWVYAVFWRIVPRIFPPPKWDVSGGGFLDRSRANKRNWILIWEDGFCDFAAATAQQSPDRRRESMRAKPGEGQSEGLKPELFFKMSHDVYNYGEGLMGKVALENGHRWVWRKPSRYGDSAPASSAWESSIDMRPRTWEAQFKSGVQTIAIITTHEGLVQLGSMQQLVEDRDLVRIVKERFDLPQTGREAAGELLAWNGVSGGQALTVPFPPPVSGVRLGRNAADLGGPMVAPPVPSAMSSLQALLSKLPSVLTPPPSTMLIGHRSGTQPAINDTSFAPLQLQRQPAAEDASELQIASKAFGPFLGNDYHMNS